MVGEVEVELALRSEFLDNLNLWGFSLLLALLLFRDDLCILDKVEWDTAFSYKDEDKQMTSKLYYDTSASLLFE